MPRKIKSALRIIAALSLTGIIGLRAGAGANAGENAPIATRAADSPCALALEKAAMSDKYLFILFSKDDSQQSRAMRSVFQAAMAKLSDKADSFEVQTEDIAEKQIVERFGVTRAPMPLVLVLAPNGAITKGLPTKFDEDQLRQAFVSPATADCMRGLQDRKLVVLCVQEPAPQVKQVSLQKGVTDFTADEEYSKHSTIVVLDPRDPAETSFLKSLKIAPQTATPVTVLMAPPGAIVGTFTGVVTKEQLVAKLKSAQSSCCPGGKCGPNGCAPKK